MHKNFAMIVLHMVSHLRAEACPPPSVSTTNRLPPFGHRRRTKSTRPIRFGCSLSQCCRYWGSELCSGFLCGRWSSGHVDTLALTIRLVPEAHVRIDEPTCRCTRRWADVYSEKRFLQVVISPFTWPSLRRHRTSCRPALYRPPPAAVPLRTACGCNRSPPDTLRTPCAGCLRSR